MKNVFRRQSANFRFLVLLAALLLAFATATSAEMPVNCVKFLHYERVDERPDAFMLLDSHIGEVVAEAVKCTDIAPGEWHPMRIPERADGSSFFYLLCVNPSNREARGICFHHGAYEWLPDSKICYRVCPNQSFSKTWQFNPTKITLNIKTHSENAEFLFEVN